MKKLRQITAALLLLAFLLLAGCAQPPQESASAEASASASAQPTSGAQETAPGAAWINSDVSGNVTADMQTDPKSDFNAAVNQEWMAGTELGAQAQVSTFTERGNEVMAQIMELITDESQTSHEAELVREFYNDFIDMDSRNALGMEPMLPLLEEIRAIEDMDGLTAYIADWGNLAGAPMTTEIATDWKDSTHNAIFLSAPSFSLSDADEYKSITDVGQRKKDASEVMFKKLLVRAGYTEEDAAALWEAFFALETEMASVSIGTAEGAAEDTREKSYNPKSAAELAELSPNFPDTEILRPYIDGGIDRFILMEPEWLAKMNELYTEENLEAFKAWLVYQTLTGAAALLDQECLDIMTEYSGAAAGNTQMELPVEQLAYQMCSQLFDMAIGKLYAENYVTEETKQDVTKLVNDAVAVFRQRLEENEWLGGETKAKAIEKLDNLTIRVAYPDDWSLYDYSDYALPEGGGIIDDVLAVREKSMSEKVDKAKAEVNQDLWIKPPQEVNAYYRPTDNSINIPAGILGGDFYNPDGSVAEQMGSLGVIIGHEITHGFDSNMGSLFDKDGNLSNWWTDEDRAAFKERTDKVGAYYAGIEVLPGKYVNGEYTIGETVADLGGMSCMLELAKGMDGFDYQTFFESWAKVWKVQETEETAEYLLQIDTHAPGHLRTNVNVQQFQEFYDAFGVEEGDGMYLAPEERLSVW